MHILEGVILMALGIFLILLSLAGLVYGIMKRSKPVLIGSLIGLILIVAIWILYSYIYSLTPY